MADHLSDVNDYGVSGYRSRPERHDGGGYGRSLVVKHSIVVGRHKTSISLEELFWNALRDIARARNLTLAELVGRIDGERQHSNLSSAIRLFVFEHCRNR